MDGSTQLRTVLIVDDEANLVRALQIVLSSAGYRVLTASDGDRALEDIRAERPDLVLLDVRMPTVSGYEVCQSVRADPALRGIPILMMSALCRDIAVEKALSMGADGFIEKPFSSVELLDRVGELIRARATA